MGWPDREEMDQEEEYNMRKSGGLMKVNQELLATPGPG